MNMLTVNAYAATSATAPLASTTIDRRDLGPHDVLIDIKFCGICHSDIHTARSEWGPTRYPVVPGHEIAGIVTASRLRGHPSTVVGDRVGVGCMVDSCRECESCRRGEEQYCRNGSTLTYNSIGEDGQPTHGGYATHIVVTEDFVVTIPDGIELDAAAPLLCAGITTYSPLRHWGAGPGTKVGVVGFGGLGHMAVKLRAHDGRGGLRAVAVAEEARRRPAPRRRPILRHRRPGDLRAARRFAPILDLIVNTVSATIDLDAYLSLLTLDGAMVNVGAPSDPFELGAFSLLRYRRSLAGSAIGGIRETQEMLDFCAEHHLGAEIEVISADQINEAYERVLASDVRYRFVIDTSTLN